MTRPVPRLWPERTVVCIASGPSLTQADVDFVSDMQVADIVKVVVINDTYKKAPWADALFAADWRWWERNQEARLFAGLKFSADRRVENTHYPEVHTLRITNHAAFDPNPACITSGANSGHMALHTAVHLGARKVVLLGYDMQPAKDGRLHHHGDHPEQRPPQFRTWINAMTGLAAELRVRGIEVVNASRDTALHCFPRVFLHEALCASVS